MFVVDDLVGWLVERLADAGYQKLKRLVVGSDDERELIEAVKAAVRASASEISPSDKGRASKLTEVGLGVGIAGQARATRGVALSVRPVASQQRSAERHDNRHNDMFGVTGQESLH